MQYCLYCISQPFHCNVNLEFNFYFGQKIILEDDVKRK